MAGFISFSKAFTLFHKKYGSNYSSTDLYDDFLFSNELDLFIQIKDASICEVSQSGFNDDCFFIHRIYPHSGYARIEISEQITSLLNKDVSSISLNEITGIYDSKKLSTKSFNASLFFNKNIDYNYYNSTEDIDILDISKKHEKLNLNITLNHLFFKRDQLSQNGINLNESNPESSNSDKPLHIKEKKSIGLIIAAFAELAKIDISAPNSNNHKENLLPLIDSLDPDGNKMDPKTLAKYLKYAITHSEIKTKKSSK